MNPDRLLLDHPGETLPWLRQQLRLNRRAFAAWLGVVEFAVIRWERRQSAIPLAFYPRLVPLLERYLPTPEGEAFLQTLGDGEGETTP
jgi:hypothetical protein